jgi:Ubiquitin-like domain
MITRAFQDIDPFNHVKDGHYDLVGPHGEIILPLAWEDTIQPDWVIFMDMWPGPSMTPLTARGRVELRTDQGHRIYRSFPLQAPPEYITFQDCVGRTFLLPFRLVERWTVSKFRVKILVTNDNLGHGKAYKARLQMY